MRASHFIDTEYHHHHHHHHQSSIIISHSVFPSYFTRIHIHEWIYDAMLKMCPRNVQARVTVGKERTEEEDGRGRECLHFSWHHVPGYEHRRAHG